MNLYNEIDPYAAQWLRNLESAGEIPPGVVDERSIEDLDPDYVRRFTQFHAFCGLGGWPLVFRLVGIPPTRRAWTGSCPCQPFSAAGKGGGFADERHLWPAFDWLIGKCRPDLVLGEQVEGPAGRTWLDLVATDLEGHGYAFGTAVFPAAGVGAPVWRHRTYWVADRDNSRLEGRPGMQERTGQCAAGANGLASRLASPDSGERRRLASSGWSECDGQAGGRQQGYGGASGDSEAGRVADPQRDGRREECADVGGEFVGDRAQGRCSGLGPSGGDNRPSPVNGFWRASDWLYCRDDKWRPVEPGTFPLASGASARVGRLRAYGNAICVPQAVAFVEAVIAASTVLLAKQQLAAE